jgi:uncharacterized protein (DUF58 family)
MILPQPRLIVWACAWAIPAAVVAALLPGAADMALLAVAVAMLLPAYDAVNSHLRSSQIRVELPPLLRMTQSQKFRVAMRIHRNGSRESMLRIGLPMPPNLQGCDEDRTVRLPEGEEFQVEFECNPRERGTYRIERCYVGSLSAAKFWLHRRTVPMATEARVYPDLSYEKKRLTGVFLNRGMVGAHAQRQIGHGRDFEQLREYVQGDAYSEIAWKATARRGSPITQVFQLERTQEVYVAIDSSRLSARPVAADGPGGPAGKTTLDRFIAAAMIMGMVAQRQGDRFGVLGFSDGVDTFIRANTGREHYRTCREAIYSLQSRPVTTDFGELLSFLRLRLRGRALLVVLSDLDDPILAENFARAVPVVADKHLVMVNMIQPPTVREMFSDPSAGTTEDVYRKLVGHLQFAHLRELQKTLRRRGVGFSFTPNEELCTDLVRQYLSIKKRQLL